MDVRRAQDVLLVLTLVSERDFSQSQLLLCAGRPACAGPGVMGMAGW